MKLNLINLGNWAGAIKIFVASIVQVLLCISMKPEILEIGNMRHARRMVSSMLSSYGKDDFARLVRETSRELENRNLNIMFRILKNFSAIFMFWVLLIIIEKINFVADLFIYVLYGAIIASIVFVVWLSGELSDILSIRRFLNASEEASFGDFSFEVSNSRVGGFFSILMEFLGAAALLIGLIIRGLLVIIVLGAIFYSWFSWMKVGLHLDSYIMIGLGLLPPTAPFATLVGAYIWLFETPDWVFSLFG